MFKVVTGDTGYRGTSAYNRFSTLLIAGKSTEQNSTHW